MTASGVSGLRARHEIADTGDEAAVSNITLPRVSLSDLLFQVTGQLLALHRIFPRSTPRIPTATTGLSVAALS